MKSQQEKIGILTIFFIFLVALSFSLYAYPSQLQPDTASAPQVEQPPDKIHPAPQNIKEKIGIYVFLGWLWLSILVLIYFLRLKIQEADRLYELGFFPSSNDKAST